MYHLITTAYGYLVLAGFSVGAYAFLMERVGFEDGFTCDLQEGTITEATYADIFPIMVEWQSAKDCKANIK